LQFGKRSLGTGREDFRSETEKGPGGYRKNGIATPSITGRFSKTRYGDPEVSNGTSRGLILYPTTVRSAG